MEDTVARAMKVVQRIFEHRRQIDIQFGFMNH